MDTRRLNSKALRGPRSGGDGDRSATDRVDYPSSCTGTQEQSRIAA